MLYKLDKGTHDRKQHQAPFMWASSTRRLLFFPRDFDCEEISLALCTLRSLCHAALLHTFKLLAQASFLDLAFLLFLRVFKVASVAQFHQVPRLIDFSLEATEGRLDRFAIPHFNLDFNCQGGQDPAMRCVISRFKRIAKEDDIVR